MGPPNNTLGIHFYNLPKYSFDGKEQPQNVGEDEDGANCDKNFGQVHFAVIVGRVDVQTALQDASVKVYGERDINKTV